MQFCVLPGMSDISLGEGCVLRRKKSLFVHPCRVPVAPEHTRHKKSSELCRVDLVPDHAGAIPSHPHTEQAVTAAPTWTAGPLLSHQPWLCCHIPVFSRQPLCMFPAAVLTQSSPSTTFHPWECEAHKLLQQGCCEIVLPWVGKARLEQPEQEHRHFFAP